MKRFLFIMLVASPFSLQAAFDLPFHNGVINLRDRGLAGIPDFGPLLPRAAEVTAIDLSHNNLVALPASAFAAFPNLEELRVSENADLATISAAAFADNKQLRLLDLRSCALAALPPDVLQDNVRLETLLIGENHLAQLPSLSACKQLQVLEAAHNELAEFPDCHELTKLAVLVLDHNHLPGLPAGRLPIGAERALQYVLCTHNQIAGIAPDVIAALPRRGLVDLRNNPCWQNAATKDALVAHGYQQKEGSMAAPDSSEAARISALLHDDMSAKFLDFLSRTGQLPHQYPLRRMLAQRVALAQLRTGIVGGVNFYRRNEWWIGLGIGILAGGGVGALFKEIVEEVVEEGGKQVVKYVAKHCGKSIVKGIVAGGFAAGVGGAAAIHSRHGFYLDGQTVYLDRGTGVTDVSGDLKGAYTGLARVLALLATFKQYLLAWNTYVYYLRNYDEYAYGEERLRVLIGRFEERLHLRVRETLRVESEPAFIETIHHLLAKNPAGELRRHTATDVWTATDIRGQRFDETGTAVPSITADTIVIIRNALVSFAASARGMRAALYNRYLGSRDAVPLIRMQAHAEPLRTQLRDVQLHVLEPLLTHLRERNWRLQPDTTEEEGRFDEWYAEVGHLAAVAREARDALLAV